MNKCPKCNKEVTEFNGVYYEANGKKYPIFQNEVKSYNGWNDTHDWEEVHFCCDEEFIIYNGI